MNINLDENIIQLQPYRDLKEYIYQTILSLYKEIEYCFFRINEVQIVPFTTIYNDCDYLGQTVAVLKDDNLYFNLIFPDIVISWIEDKTNENYDYGISIIIHELYHCREMSITSTFVDYKRIYFYKNFDTTYALVVNYAKKNFSEYYAYYYTSKYFLPTKDYNLIKILNESSKAFCIFSDVAKENLTAKLPECLWKKINSFIYVCVKLLARYHFTNDEKYLHIFDEYKDAPTYHYYYEYYIGLNSVLKEMFALYPYRMSESFLIEYGKKLFSIFKLYNLDFSTEDLSDNFVFKYIENSKVTI